MSEYDTLFIQAMKSWPTRDCEKIGYACSGFILDYHRLEGDGMSLFKFIRTKRYELFGLCGRHIVDRKRGDDSMRLRRLIVYLNKRITNGK